MPYLAELVIKYSIDWHSYLKNFIFAIFAKKDDTTPCKKSENLRKFQVVDISQKNIAINNLAC